MRQAGAPGTKPASAKSTRENSVGWLVKTLGARLDEAMKQELRSLGLTMGQFAVLMTLLECDGITQSEIGRRISMPGYATTRNLDVLEDQGLARRGVHTSSRRSHSIRLTPKGKELGPKLYAIVGRVNQDLLSGLDPADTDKLRSLLRTLVFDGPASNPPKG